MSVATNPLWEYFHKGELKNSSQYETIDAELALMEALADAEEDEIPDAVLLQKNWGIDCDQREKEHRKEEREAEKRRQEAEKEAAQRAEKERVATERKAATAAKRKAAEA
ncbi:hypothetical protein K435DRAFT_889515 [Dendrothele bispora CBS 962.96]|uniref:Uncharacterized protein n=1 Tax=Dendrothele bispora (strain CBS 962.96) TaxID=1314807 RepID=A0A4V4HB46_DENBC|nr:hypothetical protein K435DRAFT_889515 [Dendrothele bispora CBS 962.96]